MRIEEGKAGKTKSSLCLHTEKLQNHEDKETNNYRKEQFILKGIITLAEGRQQRKFLKSQVYEVQNFTANCSPT